MKYLRNVEAMNATVRTGDVNVSLPPSTSHKTEQYTTTLYMMMMTIMEKLRMAMLNLMTSLLNIEFL
jgi:hypothetical protein